MPLINDVNGSSIGMATTLQPAYNRDYKSRKALLADWVAGKDFQDALSMRYCSSRDFTRDVTIRYGQLRKVTILKYNQTTGEWK